MGTKRKRESDMGDNWVLIGNGEVIERFATELEAWAYACEYDMSGYGYLEVAWQLER